MNGYTGHKPDGETKMHDLKCGVNTRMPLSQRIAPIQTTISTRQAHTPEPVRSIFLLKRHKGETTYSSTSKDYVRTAQDVPERKKEPVASTTKNFALPKFEAVSTTTTGNAAIAGSGRPANFFSQARMIERQDDDARRNVYVAPTRAGASHFQRTVDIMRKRETAAALEPKKEEYLKVQKRPKNGLPPASAADAVKFTHISPLTSNQLDFRNPQQVANTDKINRTEARRCVSELASSCDMFAGTAKARNDLSPGFMGHVPSHPSNNSKVRGPNDVLRAYSKCSLNVANPSKQNARLVASAPSSQDMNPNRALTVQAFMERQVFEHQEEQKMNKIECGRKNAVRNFFDAGEGEADTTLADQFCTKFRPGGGVMKMGPSSSWGWISEKELKRKTVI